MDIPKHIFKSYDIRGLIDGELSDELSYRLGRAFVSFLRKKGLLQDKSIVVGRDMRESGIGFHKELVRGITDEGVNVIDIGLTTTPLFNFASIHYPEHAGGIIITASHNPAEYNGFKMTLGNGLAVGKGMGMEEIRDMVLENNFGEARGKGTVSKKLVLQDYFSHLFNLVPKESIKPLKVVLDAGNGMASTTFVDLLNELPVEAEYLYFEQDGTFPNHESNPLKTETLADLQKKVVEVGADIGFALDADCDRIGVVDNEGNIVEASFVSALIGLEVLKRYPNSDMLYDVRVSQIVPEVWEAAGGKPFMTRVGHAHIKPLMKEKNAALAGELSLHIYYKDTYNVESSDLSLLYLLELISREGKKLSEIIKPLKKYVHSGEHNFEVEDKDGAMERVKEAFSTEIIEEKDIDGLWLKFNWGFLSIRKSNTEPVLRLNLEANNEEIMKEKVEQVKKIIISS